jgi:cytochrome c oxidase assembly factor CtaG
MEHQVGLGIGIVGLLCVLIVATVALAAFVFWIWMLIHAITNKGLNDTEKLIWVLVVLFLHFIGGIVYFFVGRPKKDALVSA